MAYKHHWMNLMTPEKLRLLSKPAKIDDPCFVCSTGFYRPDPVFDDKLKCPDCGSRRRIKKD